MNLDEINQRLAGLVNGGNPAFAGAAQFVQQVIQQAQSGTMSPAEAAETVKDIQRQLDIIQDEAQLAYKEELNTIINGLITVAAWTV
jgi:polyhydroxyalkanoate synthesis regulator phasin